MNTNNSGGARRSGGGRRGKSAAGGSAGGGRAGSPQSSAQRRGSDGYPKVRAVGKKTTRGSTDETPRTGRRPANPGAARPAPARQRAPKIDVHDADGVRLQKVLASAGVGSRRKCEEMIAQGRVEVDDQVVTELGVRIDPTRHKVRVDGDYVNLDTSRAYYALNKPLGVVSSMNDEHGRPDLSFMLFNRQERLFHVGRLDADTDGLLLLTNDGELAHRLQHPSYEISKTYVATIPGPVPRDLGRSLREGVELEDGVVAVDSFKLVDSQPGRAVVEVTLHEGKKHVVRRLLEAVGHPVETLTRTAVGPVRLGQQKTGRLRELNSKEIAQLYAAAGL